jgi:hypothetical protein
MAALQRGATRSFDDGTPAAILAGFERDGAAPERALAFFDGLPAMPVEAMLGSWAGSGIATGHPLEGLLERYGWHGKRFESTEVVHPLVMGAPGASFYLDPAFLAFGFARRHPALVRSPMAAGLARRAFRLLATRKPTARLRMTEFRGVNSATMVYDAHPIHDVFRKVDDDTVLGLMDLRGDAAPGFFFFILRREG